MAPNDTRLWHKATRHKFAPAAILVVVLALSTAIVFLGIKFLSPKLTARAATPPFTNFKITALTPSTRNGDAAISPDGKYVAYAAGEGVKQSLSLRHIATGSDTAISGPEGNLAWVKFSPSGDQLYYVADVGKSANTLYRVPMFGGTPRKIIADVDSGTRAEP